jgi:uncharacterized protein
MDRSAFRRLFKCPGPVVTPVIHVQDLAQTLTNIGHAVRLGRTGDLADQPRFSGREFLPILRAARAACPDVWLGVNFLAQPGDVAFPILGRLAAEGCQIDAYWADDACMDERQPTQTKAESIAAIRAASGWQALYFGGVCFKKQRPVDPSLQRHSARIARPFMDVVTTSGIATGEATDLTKITDFPPRSRQCAFGHRVRASLRTMRWITPRMWTASSSRPVSTGRAISTTSIPHALARCLTSPEPMEPRNDRRKRPSRRPLVSVAHVAQHKGPQICLAGSDLDLHQRGCVFGSA